MVFLEANWEIGHRAYVPGATDELGNDVDSWEDPAPLMVYAVSPGASLADTEPEPHRGAVVTTWQILAPPGTVAGPHDRYVIDGVEWEQEGEVADYSRGPFGWNPGMAITVRRVTG